MTAACDLFGGRERVEAKIYATLLTLQKEGHAEFDSLPNTAREALALYDTDDFTRLLFIYNRPFDDAFPKLRELSNEEMQEWANQKVVESPSGLSQSNPLREHEIVRSIQHCALSEVLAPTKERVMTGEELEIINALRASFDTP